MNYLCSECLESKPKEACKKVELWDGGPRVLCVRSVTKVIDQGARLKLEDVERLCAEVARTGKFSKRNV